MDGEFAATTPDLTVVGSGPSNLLHSKEAARPKRERRGREYVLAVEPLKLNFFSEVFSRHSRRKLSVRRLQRGTFDAKAA
ncbi:hypothetical protein EVAR_4673_1 [Eumeta japonica]|uniref:Uncharacterized protein n=1 Tax=Eumeta variegata TaxID=151549 RepID=A0A4C1YDS2_EUMVA|nr:hypothetical protein EVAR_4673_1 [Eumeta japonica]